MLWPFNHFRKSRILSRGTIEAIYGMIVTQAREPLFYRELGVPDTVNGRFDLLVLHLWMVLRRLKPIAGSTAFAQALFDRFGDDMDANLREMGVGDLTVPKRMQAFGEAFYGRTAAYDVALADGMEPLARALCKNILGGEGIEHARQLAFYTEAAIAALAGLDDETLQSGSWRFPYAGARGRTTMNRTGSMMDKPDPWSVPVIVAQIPDTGLHRDIEADAAARVAMAELAGLREILLASASLDLMPIAGGRVHVEGRVRGRVGQTCVVTLDPIENEIDEPIDLIFAPSDQIPQLAELVDDAAESEVEIPDSPEPIENGAINLGRLATDALFLALDPYPRRPDAVFEPPDASIDPEDHPFAALKALQLDAKPTGGGKPKKS